ncbi:hypothetical protein EV122DRAFT_224011 [Schizophyllum commune]
MSADPDYPSFHHIELPPLRDPELTPLDLRPIPAPSGGIRAFGARRRAVPYGLRRDRIPATSDSDSEIDDGRPHIESTHTSIAPRAAEVNISGSAHNTLASRDAVMPAATAASPPHAETQGGVNAGTDGSQRPSLISIPDELGVDGSLIARPPGPASRPGRNGFNLQNSLGWSDSVYKYVKAWVNKEVDETMDGNRLFRDQRDKARLIRIRACNRDEMRFLKNYKDCWPVDELVKARLNYRKTRDQEIQGERSYRRSMEARRGG